MQRRTYLTSFIVSRTVSLLRYRVVERVGSGVEGSASDVGEAAEHGRRRRFRDVRFEIWGRAGGLGDQTDHVSSVFKRRGRLEEESLEI